MDLAINNSGEPAVLLHNESKTPYHWIRLELRGTQSDRDAVGAKVTVHLGQRKIVRHCKGVGSYCSSTDPRLHIALGESPRVYLLEIRWPSGRQEKFGPLEGERPYLIIEGGKSPHDPDEERKKSRTGF